MQLVRTTGLIQNRKAIFRSRGMEDNAENAGKPPPAKIFSAEEESTSSGSPDSKGPENSSALGGRHTSGSGADANTGRVDADRASLGNLFLQLPATRRALRRAVRSQGEKIQKLAEAVSAQGELMDTKMDKLSEEIVQKVTSHMSTRALSERLSKSNSGPRSDVSRAKRRRSPSPERLTYLEILFKRDRTPFAVKWSMLVTVLCFVSGMSLNGTALTSWVASNAWEEMSPYMSIMEGVSGLSVVFFSVEGGHFWVRYHGSIGKLWSFVLRRVISSTILAVRDEEFDKEETPEGSRVGRLEPPWLLSFGNIDETAAHVSEVIQHLETTQEIADDANDSAFLDRRKRLKYDVQPGDMNEVQRDYAIKKLKGIVARNWTHGRAEARKKILGELMCVVGKILEYRSREDAEREGFSVEFGSMKSLVESRIPEDIKDTIWDIKATRTAVQADDIRAADSANLSLMNSLASDFPSLWVTLRYKREIKGVDRIVPDNASVPEFWHASKPVSLHQIAAIILTASLYAPSIEFVMRSSGLALKTFHVLAIGLKGLIRKSLGENLSEMENAALGKVKMEDVGKDDIAYATTFAAKITGNANVPAGSAQAHRDATLKMSLGDYRIEEKAHRTRSTQGTGGDAASQSGHEGRRSTGNLRESFLM